MKTLAIIAAIIFALTANAKTLTATWNDNAINEDGQILQALDASGVWQDLVSVGPDVETVDFEFDAATMTELRLEAYNAFGAVYSNIVISKPPSKPDLFKVLRKVPRSIASLFKRLRKKQS